MSIPSFATRRKQWSSPPIDDVGYLPSTEMLTWNDDHLQEVISQMAQARYQGWRNWEMRWRTVLGLDNTRDKTVLDFGCGVGLEALQYAKLGNRVWLADISYDNLRLAARVLALDGHRIIGTYGITDQPPFVNLLESVDVVHCCGVLHHIPDPVPVVREMASWLNKDGELRLMVYSDEAWRIATGTEPSDLPVQDSELFERYWTHWDPIGGYADWYNRDRLQDRFGEWFQVSVCEPLTEHGEYLGAVLVKK